MGVFVSEQLCEPTLPARYAPVLDALNRFLDLTERARKLREDGIEDAFDDAALLELTRQHDALAELARAELPPHPDHLTREEAALGFTSGILRLMHYEETVTGQRGVLDTHGSETIHEFESDLIEPARHRRAVREALKSAFGYSDAEMDALVAERLTPELRAMAVRHRIIDALDSIHPIDPDDPDGDVHELFHTLYGDTPLKPGEVHLVRTATSLFFCIPYEGYRLTTRQEELVDTDEEAKLSTFLESVGNLRQRFMAHFPVFGFFRGDQVDPGVLAALAAATGEEPHEVAEALTTMVTILPSAEVDKYLVHDAWGHQWQALLFEFEQSYHEVSEYGYLPPLERAVPGHDETLLDVLDGAIDDLKEGRAIDLSSWETFMRAEISSRLIQSLSGLLAEVLADAVEYKYLELQPHRKAELLSSSFFKEYPAKLDLTMIDLGLYFWFATKGFERFYERPARRNWLAEGYLVKRPRAARAHVIAAVDALAASAEEAIERGAYQRAFFEGHDAGELAHVNLYGRSALNFLGFQTVMNDTYAHLNEAEGMSGGPFTRFQDALVFSTAGFFELNRNKNFWHLDEFVGLHFEDLWRSFLAEL